MHLHSLEDAAPLIQTLFLKERKWSVTKKLQVVSMYFGQLLPTTSPQALTPGHVKRRQTLQDVLVLAFTKLGWGQNSTTTVFFQFPLPPQTPWMPSMAAYWFIFAIPPVEGETSNWTDTKNCELRFCMLISMRLRPFWRFLQLCPGFGWDRVSFLPITTGYSLQYYPNSENRTRSATCQVRDPQKPAWGQKMLT